MDEVLQTIYTLGQTLLSVVLTEILFLKLLLYIIGTNREKTCLIFSSAQVYQHLCFMLPQWCYD